MFGPQRKPPTRVRRLVAWNVSWKYRLGMGPRSAFCCCLLCSNALSVPCKKVQGLIANCGAARWLRFPLNCPLKVNTPLLSYRFPMFSWFCTHVPPKLS